MDLQLVNGNLSSQKERTDVQPIEILLIEDEPSDARLTELTLSKSKVINRVHIVEDGFEALKFLSNQEPYKDSPRPDLIFLDLMLPRMSGQELLSKLKADEHYKDIPVIVLTASSNDRDVLSSYGLDADCFITKPLDLKQFIWVVGLIDGFSICIVK